VWGGFRAGKRQVVESLFQLRDSAYRAKEILESGNFDHFGELLASQHECAKNLDASLSNDLVEGIFDLVRPHIRGGKCCGAGGGGCMMFLSESPQQQQRAAAVLQEQGIRVIPFKFALDGLTVTRHG
jgi:D-glycero-alpha-D-manno-heptose-7-phosphate kinase